MKNWINVNDNYYQEGIKIIIIEILFKHAIIKITSRDTDDIAAFWAAILFL